MAGRKLLEKGIRRQIGNGRSTKVWQDPWVPLPHNFKPFSRSAVGKEEMRVEELMASEGGWDLNLLSELFSEYEVEIIAHIPIGVRRREDRWVWHFDKQGKYSVKSGYWLWHSSTDTDTPSSSNATRMERLWNKLWRCTVPGKVLICRWRVITNTLPTRANLLNKHVQLDDSCCVVCGRAVETIEHVVSSCWFAKEVWQISGFQKLLKLDIQLDIQSWMWYVVGALEEEQLVVFLVRIWAIWYNRNKLWGAGEYWEADSLASWCINFEREYAQVHRSGPTPTKRTNTKWLCPPSGRLKMNVDGSFNESTKEGGVGVIVRNEFGLGIAAAGRNIKHACSAFAMEVEACRIGLQLGRTKGWSNIDIESDSIQLVQALSKRELDLSEVGPIVEDCKDLIKEMQSYTIRHIYREANGVADRLARMTNSRHIDHVWLDEMPVIIRDNLIEDSSEIPIMAQLDCTSFISNSMYSDLVLNNRWENLEPD